MPRDFKRTGNTTGMQEPTGEITPLQVRELQENIRNLEARLAMLERVKPAAAAEAEERDRTRFEAGEGVLIEQSPRRVWIGMDKQKAAEIYHNCGPFEVRSRELDETAPTGARGLVVSVGPGVVNIGRAQPDALPLVAAVYPALIDPATGASVGVLSEARLLTVPAGAEEGTNYWLYAAANLSSSHTFWYGSTIQSNYYTYDEVGHVLPGGYHLNMVLSAHSPTSKDRQTRLPHRQDGVLWLPIARIKVSDVKVLEIQQYADVGNGFSLETAMPMTPGRPVFFQRQTLPGLDIATLDAATFDSQLYYYISRLQVWHVGEATGTLSFPICSNVPQYPPTGGYGTTGNRYIEAPTVGTKFFVRIPIAYLDGDVEIATPFRWVTSGQPEWHLVEAVGVHSDGWFDGDLIEVDPPETETPYVRILIATYDPAIPMNISLQHHQQSDVDLVAFQIHRSLSDGTAAGQFPVWTSGAWQLSSGGAAGNVWKWVADGGGAWSPVSWDDVASKPTSFTPATHSHAWTDITSKPTEFPPEAHTHDWADINDPPPQVPDPPAAADLFLGSSGTASGAFGWVAIRQVPTGGTSGYVLVTDGTNYAWAAAPAEIPVPDASGKALKSTGTTAGAWEWAAIREVPTGGTSGNVLVSDGTNYAWAAAPTGLPALANGATGILRGDGATPAAWFEDEGIGADTILMTSATGWVDKAGAKGSILVGNDTSNGWKESKTSDANITGDVKLLGQSASSVVGWRALAKGSILAGNAAGTGAMEVVAGASGTGKALFQTADGVLGWLLAPSGLPENPGSPATIGVTTEGAEAADTTTWAASAGAGVQLHVMGRVGYFDAGGEILYGYVRTLKFDKFGRLASISAETRVTIDVPE
jgi:hypothetical protein